MEFSDIRKHHKYHSLNPEMGQIVDDDDDLPLPWAAKHEVTSRVEVGGRLFLTPFSEGHVQ